MRVSERMKKWISMALCLCMLVQNCPVVAFAAEDNLCTHHPEHTAECHYAQGSAGAPCTHVHDAECGYREAVAEVRCACEATDENGALVHTEGCGYVAPVTGADCAHVHDDACGYAAAVEAHECHYECAECANSDVIANQSEDWCGNPLCSQEDAFHVTSCAQYVAPENPQCFCVEKCTEPNVWCDVCGFDIAACGGEGEAASFVTNPTGKAGLLYTGSNQVLINATEADSGYKWGYFAYGYGGEPTVFLPEEWTPPERAEVDQYTVHCYHIPDTLEGLEALLDYCAKNGIKFTVYIYPSVTTAPVGATGLYANGSAQTLISAEGVPAGGYGPDMLYSVTDGSATSPGSFSTSLPTATEAGTYKVWYKARSQSATVWGTKRLTIDAPNSAAQYITVTIGRVTTNQITWILEGETYATTAQTTGQKLTLPDTPTKAPTDCVSYTFDGWFTAAQGGERVTAETVYSVNTDTTYYGRFTKVNTHDPALASYSANGFCLDCDAYQPAADSDSNGYYEIDNAGKLYWFAQQVNSGSTAINGELKADIKVNENVLTADGALNGDGSNFRAWTPIGTEANAYTGEFRGSEHTVSGLYVNGSADYVGLFGYVGSGGTVENVGVIDSYLDGGSYVGGVVGYNDISGTVQYVYNTGNIQGSNYVGGVVGRNQYIVRYAYNTGTVFAQNYAGGVVGHNNYILEYAYNTGSASDWFNYSGVTGYNRDSTKLKNCYYLADSETDELDGTTAKTAGQFEIGEVAYLLGSPFGQNIGTHVSPVLNLGYTVYEVRNCKNETIYSNTNANTGHIGGTATCIEKAVCTVCGASYGAVGEHSTTAEGDIAADCNSKAYCSVCDSEYGEVDTTNHDSSVDFNDNGFCPNGCYEPATDSDSDGYYEIDNAGKLYWFAAQVNSGNTAINGKLTQNIVVNEGTLTAETTDARAWTPIGQSPYLYNGTFNGGEFTVSGLYCGDSSAYYASLFGAVDDEGIVENVGVIDSYLNGTAYAGGVVGQNWGTVASCYNTGTVCGSGCVGGVVSRNAGTVTNCRNTGNVTGINSSIGGVVGCSDDGTVASCYNTGAVSGDYYVGGVVGSSDISSVKNCYNTGNVTGTDSVGGVVGASNNCTVENCYNIGFVSGIANYIGGVIGINKSTVTNCYYLSGYAVDGNNTVQFGIGNPYLGGTTADIAGQTAGKFSAQFASGEVAYLLQGQQTEQVWGQVIGIEDHPVLGGKKVYCGYTSCGDTAEKYTNDETVSAEKPAHSTGAVGDKAATCTAPAYCSVCDSEYGEVDKTNHDTENAEYDNGFCPNCDAYEPAELVDGVYQISNAGNLYWFADKVTNENAAYGSADAILTCDIRVNEGTMTEASTDARVWTPIGKIGLVGNQVVRYPYTGTFEGNGKTVSGLYFNDTSANFDVGLFSLVGEGGKVQNVGVADSYLCGSQSIGAVVGNNFGTVTGCYNTGTVISSGTAGGVVGANSGTVTGCYNTGTVSGTDSVGGVVGSSRGSYTYGSGSIMCNAIVTDCYNTGAVSGTTDVGGVVGYNGAYYSSSSGIVFSTAIVTDCHNTGTVSGKNNVGGVVGAHSGTVMGCYNTGTVSSESSVGGVVAYNNGIVMDCYHSGSISGTTYVGGVVGNNIVNNTSTGTVTNCYFDSTVYTGNAIGTNEGTATNVEGKSTEQFASGEVAYLLSQGENGSIWGQDLDNGKTKQTTPTFTGAKVYCGYTSCGDTAAVYTNNANVFPEKPEHTQNPTYTDNHNGTHSAVYPCCGTKGQPENHTLTYTANGNIITASCSANCGYGGTATISATGKTYDGNAVEVVVSKTGSLENTDIPVTLTKDGEAFTGEPVNAGTYTASVTLGDKTVSVDFTIAKADAIIALAPTPNSGLTYTGEAQYLISPGSAEGGILVYSLSEDGELYETIPQGTDAGEYSVWYFVQGDENHNDSARDSVPVTIQKATVTVTADAKSKTYGEADPELTYTASGLFGEDKLTGALTRAEGENVGSYAITQGTLTAGDNYTISFTGAEFAIGVKDVDVMTMEVEVTLEQDSYAYDGTAKEPEVTSIIVDGVKLTEDVDYRVLSYERNIYVGEAEVVIHFIGNYRGSLSRFFQITKAPLTVTADSKTMITGQELPTFTYTITGFVGGESEDVLTAKPTVSCEADGKTAGTYGITVSGAAADNYEITHVNGTLTVADHQHAWTYTAEGDTITAICGNGSTCPEAEQTITICAEGKIYDGKPVTAELDGSIEGVDDPEITYSGNTDAGTYTASIKLGKATASVEFTIEKATPTVAWANTSESVNYTGVAAVITAPTVTLVNGEPFGGTISYAYTGTSSGSGLPTNAGTYEITASIDAQGSYNAAASTNKLTLTINKVDPVYTVPTGLTATYGDTLADVALPEGFRWTDSSESVGAVGTKNTTVIYTPADTANYNTVTNIAVSVAVKAAAATVTAAPTPNDLTYTGEAQELITAGEAEGGTMHYQLNGGEWSDKIPTAKDEGIYTVSWKVVGDANHADTEVKSITVTIGDCTHSGNTNKDDADCTTQVTCSVCGDVLVEAKAHVWADWTTTLEPTTTTEGSKERLCTNDGCEAKDTKSIPMLNEVEVPKPEGGDVSVDNPTPATGEDVTITVTPDTGKEVVDVVVRDKNDNEITVTKNEDGTYTYEQPDSDVTVEVILKDTIYTVTWTVDGKTYAEQTYKYGEHITAPADPTKAQSGCTVYTFHKWNGFTAGMTMPDEKELTFAAEFTEEGSHIDDNRNHICDRECGKTDIGLHADAADDKDHVCDYGCGDVLETCSGGTATCMAEAVCAVCGESYGSKDPQNHTGSTHVENAEDPTCAEPGYTGDTVCECGETIGAGEQIPATGEHDYHNGTCSVCGGKDPNYNKPGWGGIWDWIFGGWWGQGNKCDHSYTAVVTAPTCTEKGYTTYTCSKCGDCYKDSYTNALGHAWDKGVVTKEPTCTENGVKTYTCGRCGHQKTETIQATGHNYQDGICGGCGAQKPTEPSVPDKPDKPNKPVWGGIWDWIFGGWWK